MKYEETFEQREFRLMRRIENAWNDALVREILTNQHDQFRECVDMFYDKIERDPKAREHALRIANTVAKEERLRDDPSQEI